MGIGNRLMMRNKYNPSRAAANRSHPGGAAFNQIGGLKMETRTYCVANDNGELAGHDLDHAHAEQVLEAMQKSEPNAGWEIIDTNGEE